MAMFILEKVVAPTLLIVGGYDTTVLELNHEAFTQLGGHKEIKIIPKKINEARSKPDNDNDNRVVTYSSKSL